MEREGCRVTSDKKWETNPNTPEDFGINIIEKHELIPIGSLKAAHEEIEHLKEQNSDCKALHEASLEMRKELIAAQDEIARLKAENLKLREALEKINGK